MYNLGEHFKINYNNIKSDPSTMLIGKKYRITILTERLIRLEYNEDGVFEDRPTRLVLNRNFEKINFNVKQDDKYLEITTKYFKLTYNKEAQFKGSTLNPASNLKIELLNTTKVWHYEHKEIRNFGTASYIDDNNNKVIMHKGLYSTDGFVSIDDSLDDVFLEDGTISKRDKKGIDIYVFMYLKDFALALRDYFMLTGYPSLIPRYALGNWWSRNVNYNDYTLNTLINDFNRYEIPISVLLFNHNWHIRNNNLKTGFTWNKENFKTPYEMINSIHKRNIKIGLNIDPSEGFYPYEENFNKAKEYLEVDKNGIIPFNVIEPKVLDVYFKVFIHPLETLGADFFWIDTDYNKKDLLFYLNHYHTYDSLRNDTKRPLIMSYDSRIANHRYPILYSGNSIVSWDTLKKIPTYNSSASNNGVSFWSHDIGGFHNGIEDGELYTRFVQLGTFSPILKFGGESGKYYKREPWLWSNDVYENTKDYLNLRHKLIPYIYTESYKYHKYGMPIIQPIYYKYPEMYDDVNFKNEYYFGTEFFVSPILSKKNVVMNRVVHKFFLPDGVWYDFVTGKKFPGGKSYISFFRDSDYPVFAKAGSIIPMGMNTDINDTNPPKNMEIQVFPGVSNSYELYEDDGVSNMYKKGFYLLTNIEYNYLPNNYTIIIRSIDGKSGIVPDMRNYKIRFRNTKRANEVIAYFNSNQLNVNSYVSGPDFIVEINDVPTVGQLSINCKGKDIEIDAVRLINEDIASIISDLQIKTELKEKIDSIIFSDLPIKKKRIEIRKLSKYKLEPKFISLFLNLLEYIAQV